MSDRPLLVLGALAGLGYGLLEIGGVVVGAAANPVPFDIFPSAETAAKLAATVMPTGVWVGFGMEVVATLLLVAFMVRATVAVREADRPGLLATLALAAGVVNVAAVFVSFGIIAARNAGAGHGLDAQSVILLADLNWGAYFLSWPSFAMFIGCLAAAALRARALPAWLGWAGVVVAVAGLAGCLDPVNLGQLAQLLPLVWIPAAGIALAIRRMQAAPSAAAVLTA